jgi:hypothetical protein
MNDSDRPEQCVVCGKSTEGNRGFSHVTHADRTYALCCPMCLDLFPRAPDRFAHGERHETVLEELVTRLRWKSDDQS